MGDLGKAMDIPGRARHGRAWFAALLGLLPFLCFLPFIKDHYFHTPFWDDWSLIETYLNLKSSGGASWKELFGLHSGNLLLFPCLVYAADFHWLGGDLGYVIGLTILLAVGVWYFTVRLAMRTLSRERGLFFPILLASLLLFSPSQGLIWMWPMIYFWPGTGLAIAAGIYLIDGHAGKLWPHLVTLLLCLMSAGSQANGFFTPLIILFFLVLRHAWEWRKVRWPLAGWLAVSLIFIGSYGLMQLSSPGQNGEDMGGRHLGHVIHFFFVLLGSGLSHLSTIDAVTSATAIGMLLFGAYAAICVCLALTRDLDLIRKAAPWLTLGAFSLASGAMIAWARGVMELHVGLTDRYISATLYLPLSLIFLFPMVLTETVKRFRPAALPVLAPVWGGLGGALLVLLIGNWMDGLRFMEAEQTSQLQGEARLNLINLFPIDGLEAVYPFSGKLPSLVNQLAQMRCLKPVKLFKSDELDQGPFKIAFSPFSKGRAQFVNLEQTANGAYIARGFADARADRGEVDLVLLTWKAANRPTGDKRGEGEHIFDIAPVEMPWQFLAEQQAVHARWETTLSLERLPAETEVIVRAYALDQQNHRFISIPGEFPLTRKAGP